jgi:hypothetical protein
MNKAAAIRHLLSLGLKGREIAEKLDVTVKYVAQERWRMQRPGYKANWQRNKRASDRRELDRQNRRKAQQRASA